MNDQRIALINVSGPYGVGKDSMLQAIVAALGPRAHRVGTVTTRPVDRDFDPSYRSVTPEEFANTVQRGRWLVNTQLDGKVNYATSLDEIDAIADQGGVAVHSIFAGPDGAGSLRRALGPRLLSFGLVATPHGNHEVELAELSRRLKARGRETPEVIASRLAHQAEKIDYVRSNPLVRTPYGPMPVFDHILVNSDLAEAKASIVDLVDHALSYR